MRDSTILWLKQAEVIRLEKYVQRAQSAGFDRRILRVQLLEGSWDTYLVEYVS